MDTGDFLLAISEVRPTLSRGLVREFEEDIEDFARFWFPCSKHSSEQSERIAQMRLLEKPSRNSLEKTENDGPSSSAKT